MDSDVTSEMLHAGSQSMGSDRKSGLMHASVTADNMDNSCDIVLASIAIADSHVRLHNKHYPQPGMQARVVRDCQKA